MTKNKRGRPRKSVRNVGYSMTDQALDVLAQFKASGAEKSDVVNVAVLAHGRRHGFKPREDLHTLAEGDHTLGRHIAEALGAGRGCDSEIEGVDFEEAA